MDWLRFMATLLKQIIQSLYYYIFLWRGSLSEGSMKRVKSPRRSETEPGKKPEKIVYPVVLLLRPLTCCETREVDLWQATSSSSLVAVPSPRRGCLPLPARFAPAYAHPKNAKNNTCSKG